MVGRRGFLKWGLVGTSVLAAVGLGSTFVGRDAAGDRRTVLRGIAPALLAGAIPPPGAEHEAELARLLDGLVVAIESLSPQSQHELRLLFLLLATPGGRWLAGIGSSWERAEPEQVAHALQQWRAHRLALMQTAYHALHDLVLGTWYAEPSHWERIGYPGPPRL
ncbi:MAG: hypothetical protein JSW68_04220 [Burkholderiales bacterium]|nr:MAG: hypothetical protein JSW68_04220 [Burkholderiales bacterium]